MKSIKADGIGEAKHRKKYGRNFDMNDKENLVIDEITDQNETEQIEETAAPNEAAEAGEAVPQKQERLYTSKEVDAIAARKKAMTEAKVRREYEKKYGRLESVLRTGTGKQTIEEITDDLSKYYEGKGVTFKSEPEYSERDVEVLAMADADEIIGAGDDEVAEALAEYSRIGTERMTPRDKAIFKALAEHRQGSEELRALAELGVTEEEYNSKDFRSFRRKFAKDTPIGEIYAMYEKIQPRKNFKPMGSVTHTTGVGKKDYYTPEEISALTEEDLDDPQVWNTVRRSMTGGK